jgi:hypothetical protein
MMQKGNVRGVSSLQSISSSKLGNSFIQAALDVKAHAHGRLVHFMGHEQLLFASHVTLVMDHIQQWHLPKGVLWKWTRSKFNMFFLNSTSDCKQKMPKLWPTLGHNIIALFIIIKPLIWSY